MTNSSQHPEQQPPTAEQPASTVDVVDDVLSVIDGPIVEGWRNGKPWRSGMQIEREPHPDAEIDEALRLFGHARSRAARKSEQQNKQRGAGAELLALIDGLAAFTGKLAGPAFVESWHRDKALPLVAAIARHEKDNNRKDAALAALSGLADALDGIQTLQRIAGPAVRLQLQQQRGPTKDIAMQQLVNRLASYFEALTGKTATITTDPISGQIYAAEGGFLIFAMQAVGYLPGNISPTESQIAHYARARLKKASKAESSTGSG